MKLYGVAIAIIPKKDNAQIYQVTCTPIAMDQANQRSFEVLHDLAYQQDVDSMDVPASTQAFMKGQRTIEAVIKLQEKSCNDAGVDYIPIGLDIGQHSKYKIKLDAGYALLFGEHTKANFHLLYEKGQKQALPDIDKFKAIRAAYLATHGHMPYEFVEECKKIPDLASKCVFEQGGYGPDQHSDEAARLSETEMDKELKQLKPKFEKGDAGARTRLLELAQAYGEQVGKENRYGALLQLPVPHYYADDTALQERLPRHGFVAWDMAFEDAFHKAYSDTVFMGGHHTLILPHHERHPFFTDPVADLIRTQFQILEGARDPNNSFDQNAIMLYDIEPIDRFVKREEARGNIDQRIRK